MNTYMRRIEKRANMLSSIVQSINWIKKGNLMCLLRRRQTFDPFLRIKEYSDCRVLASCVVAMNSKKKNIERECDKLVIDLLAACAFLVLETKPPTKRSIGSLRHVVEQEYRCVSGKNTKSLFIDSSRNKHMKTCNQQYWSLRNKCDSSGISFSSICLKAEYFIDKMKENDWRTVQNIILKERSLPVANSVI